MELCDHSAVEMRRMLADGEISAVELLSSCLRRIDATNPAINAFVALARTRARNEARRADRARRRGDPLGPLHGLPLGIKDLNDTEGLVTTYGSTLYRDHIPERDDRVVAGLRAAGAIVLGKTNTPEFGAGSNTINEVYGATVNPFGHEYTSGGSSGGSAAALAAGMVPLAQGSDTGGSLRAPATWCGVASIRPTPGLVASDKRTIPLTFFSVQGPMARCIDDLKLMLGPMAGPSGDDPMSFPRVPPGPEAPVDLTALRVGFSADLGVAPIDDRIRDVFERRVSAIAPAFASMGRMNPDFFRHAREVFWILRSVAFLANHLGRYRTHGDLLSANIRANVEAGLAMTAEQVAWAESEWARIARSFAALFEDIDILLCPGNATAPFLLRDGIPREINGRRLENYMDASLIRSALTLTGHPIVALACGKDPTGMPFGFQVVGQRHRDFALLGISAALERHLESDPELARPLPSDADRGYSFGLEDP